MTAAKERDSLRNALSVVEIYLTRHIDSTEKGAGLKGLRRDLMDLRSFTRERLFASRQSRSRKAVARG